VSEAAGRRASDAAAARLAAVSERIARAAARAGRRADEVTLVGVAKRHPAEAVAAAAAAGLVHVGESFVQEARAKIPRVAELRGPLAAPLVWHFVGRLQTNKAKLAATLFDAVDSVDRAELAHALDRHAAALGRTLDVLIQVNVSGEAQKGGAAPDALGELAAVVGGCAQLRLRGLMTVPAASEDPEAARPAFARLRELRDALCRSAPGLTLPELSMGMSADLEVAVEEGATIVRVGTALFGPRGQT
jgi:pyridoxal phosphate enzyme (YggS family)